MRRVLMISETFPPYNRSGSQRPFQFAKYLPEYGYLPSVLSAEPGPTDMWRGLEVAPLDGGYDSRVEELRDRFEIEGESGVLVVEVLEGTPAAEARLQPGDVIVEMARATVSDMSEFFAAVERLRDVAEPVNLLVRRDGLNSYITVQPGSENDGRMN